jgi:hypothetical protein
MDLTTPPPSLTPRQRSVFWILTVVSALTRLLALSKTLWEWDEVLFCLGLRDYDIALHHPHPPGFPLYVGLGKLLRPLVDSDFHAFQAINLVTAMLVFPAIFLLARELRFRFSTAAIAAALFAFLPNVWFFGGTAFSDIPSIVTVVFAVVFLLRGVRSPRDYFIGTLLLAMAAGIRSQNLLIGLVPGLIASRARRPREIAAAAILGFVVLATTYGAAIEATGSFERFRGAVSNHGQYISRIDSFRSPTRPALWRMFDRFFFKQYQAPALSVIMSLLAIGSIVGAIRDRDRRMLLNAAIFVPFAFFAWLMLDRYSVNRFSIGYAPMFVLFAADGLRRLARNRERYEVLAGGILVVAFVVWTLPALSIVRSTVSPPLVAVDHLRRTFDPAKQKLFVGHSMTAFLDYLAPELHYVRVLDDRAIPAGDVHLQPLLLAEVTETPEGTVFRRERGHLWNIARRLYFEITLKTIEVAPRFGAGWYAAEGDGRWSSAHSIAELPARTGPTVLRLDLQVPAELVPMRPVVTVKVNGAIADRIVVTEGSIQRSIKLLPSGWGANTLEIFSSRSVNPKRAGTGDDVRDLSFLLRGLSWGPT